ncbi:MAG: helix-turn-helix domain-containing protein [Clostridiales bacterium]|nr:helix-turn-helix domain-containing protein [Clostridiales bacterium]
MQALTTDEMLRLLRNADEVEGIIKDWQPQPMLPAHLKELVKLSGLTFRELIFQANLDRTYAYQILKGTRKPGRDMLLAVAFALRLNLKATQRLLCIGGRSALYPRVRRDAILIFCLEHGLNYDEAEEKLEAAGEVPLFKGLG